MTFKMRIGYEHLSTRGPYNYGPSLEMMEWCKTNLRTKVRFSSSLMPERHFAHLDDEIDALHFKMKYS